MISGKAEKVITALQSKGYRVWFDNGLIAGSSYNDVIAKYISDCEVFLCLQLQRYSKDYRCNDEQGNDTLFHISNRCIHLFHIKRGSLSSGGDDF